MAGLIVAAVRFEDEEGTEVNEVNFGPVFSLKDDHVDDDDSCDACSLPHYKSWGYHYDISRGPLTDEDIRKRIRC